MSKTENNNKSSRKLTDAKLFCPATGGQLALRIVLALLIPYAYLWLCGLVFDKWLHMYHMVTFIFFSMIALYVVALVYIVICVVNFGKLGKRPRRTGNKK